MMTYKGTHDCDIEEGQEHGANYFSLHIFTISVYFGG